MSARENYILGTCDRAVLQLVDRVPTATPRKHVCPVSIDVGNCGRLTVPPHGKTSGRDEERKEPASPD